jgi:tRNA splicing ligase
MKCNTCQQEKDIEDFYYDSYNKTLYKRCKACKNVKLLSDEEYEKVLLSQRGVCAICNKVNTITSKKGKIFRLSVDHDHNTGEVRGLLCHDCNIGLGKFKDSTLLLSKAISYLS